MHSKLLSTIFLLSSAMTIVSCDTISRPFQPGFSGEDLTDSFEIVRDDSTKSVSLYAGEDTRWELYYGLSTADIDLSQPIAKGNTQGTFEISIPTSRHCYFQLSTPDGNALLAERHIPLEGGYNFRDMGGFRTQDGKYVKWGKVFRADDLHTLTDNDLEYLASIPVASVVDLRSLSEIEKYPDRLPQSVNKHYIYSIPGEDASATILSKAISADTTKVVKLIEDIYANYLMSPDCIEQYRKLFSLLEDESNLPLTFHCSDGQEKTGIAAALFLTALGVDEHTVIDDYLASAYYLEAKHAIMTGQNPNLEILLHPRQEYMEACFNTITEEYGSSENFFRDAMHADIDKLKEIYLY